MSDLHLGGAHRQTASPIGSMCVCGYSMSAHTVVVSLAALLGSALGSQWMTTCQPHASMSVSISLSFVRHPPPIGFTPLYWQEHWRSVLPGPLHLAALPFHRKAKPEQLILGYRFSPEHMFFGRSAAWPEQGMRQGAQTCGTGLGVGMFS